MGEESLGLAVKVRLEIPWRTLLKVLAAIALGWTLVQLLPIVLIAIVAIVLAVSLDPIVAWLEQRRLPRTAAAIIVAIVLVVSFGGFLWLTWSSLASQWEQVAGQVVNAVRDVWNRVPEWLRSALGSPQDGSTSPADGFAVRVFSSTTSAIGSILLGFVLTIYLLIEGRKTYAWVAAFVPRRHRAKAERTATESREVIFGYVIGNAITSAIAFAATFVALWLLDVPAALLLALLAGLSDFVPVIGFVLSAIPAVLLAFTVSSTTAMLVIGFYVLYNGIEAYVLSPWAYGNRMKLSDVAVILGFAAGAQLGGVIGALIALPIAALYPTIERIWLRRELPDGTVREHTVIEAAAPRRAAR
jgi:predicted PurR-regulated permease PerM